jgi:hypothetical protein
LEYWHKKLSVEPLAQYATTINTRMTENGDLPSCNLPS